MQGQLEKIVNTNNIHKFCSHIEIFFIKKKV